MQSSSFFSQIHNVIYTLNDQSFLFHLIDPIFSLIHLVLGVHA